MEASIGVLWKYMMGDCEPGFEFSGMAVLAMQNCRASCLNPRNWFGKGKKVNIKSRVSNERVHALSEVVDNTQLRSTPKKKRRPYTRKKTVKNAWDKAENGSKENSKKCPDCGKDVVGNPHNKELRNTPDGWDLEHVEKWEKIRRGLDKKGAKPSEYNDAYNDLNNTILRCRSCNRSDNQL